MDKAGKIALRILPLLSILWLGGCAVSPQPEGNYWRVNDCPANPPDREIHPALAKELKRSSSSMTASAIDSLKKANAFNRELDGLNKLRRYYAASTVPYPGKDIEIVSRAMDDGEIPLRVYIPAAARKNKLPVVLYFHGGGWCLGSAANTDIISIGLCRAIPAIVVSVDYRLAPENPFPAALDDAVAAIGWVGKNTAEFNADPRRVYLAGDSAGGNLAAAAGLRNTVEKGPEVKGVILFYPVVNLLKTAAFSWTRFGNGYGLDTSLVEAFINCYTPYPKERNRHYASPLFADMRYMPPALVVTAQFDPLRDDAGKFAERMRQQSRPVRYVCLPGMTHAYLETPALKEEYAATMKEAAEFVRQTSTPANASPAPAK